MKIGDTFWLATYPGYVAHLWVVIAQSQGKVLIVNFSTLRDQADLSCVVRAGEHPDLTKDSVVLYHFAREADPEALNAAVAKGLLRTGTSFTGQLLVRILTGALKSSHLRRRFKRWIEIPN